MAKNTKGRVDATISLEKFQVQYNQLKPKYESLAINLQQALKTFLSDKKIPFLDVTFRVKDSDSAYKKIARKEYQQPFEEIEDWCGLRIICYYPSDVDPICEILKAEFDVHTQEDTSLRLAPEQFGYRSTHFILKVKSSWMQTPNYRDLQGFKVEVQIRTVLMHAWAEVEHSLLYKSDSQVPSQFKRKFSILSALFEIADGQFQELRNGIESYREEIRKKITQGSAFREEELNLDTLHAFLDSEFPERQRGIYGTSSLIDEFKEVGITTMAEVIDAYETAKKIALELEKERIGDLDQSGILRMNLDIASDKYYKYRKELFESKGGVVYEKWMNEVNRGKALLSAHS